MKEKDKIKNRIIKKNTPSEENTNYISILNEDGSIKDKDEFLESISELYDKVQEQYAPVEEEEEEEYDDEECDEDCDCEGTPISYFDVITHPDAAIDVESTLATFDFIERSIYLTDEIKKEDANSFCDIVRFWNKVDNEDDVPVEDRDPIKVYINTPGGDLDAVFSIISSIKASKTPVYTITIGTGYSGGFFIGICGHKRYGLYHASFMHHKGACMDGGDAQKLIQHVRFYERQLDRLKQIVLENTNITNDEFDSHQNDDWMMDSHDAIRYGVIDEILDTII